MDCSFRTQSLFLDKSKSELGDDEPWERVDRKPKKKKKATITHSTELVDFKAPPKPKAKESSFFTREAIALGFKALALLRFVEDPKLHFASHKIKPHHSKAKRVGHSFHAIQSLMDVQNIFSQNRDGSPALIQLGKRAIAIADATALVPFEAAETLYNLDHTQLARQAMMVYELFRPNLVQPVELTDFRVKASSSTVLEIKKYTRSALAALSLLRFAMKTQN